MSDTDLSVKNLENSEKIEIFSTDDDKIKTLVDLFSSDASRKILNLLFENEMTASEIANNTGISIELARYHIQKMQKIGLVHISKIQKNSREQDMKYYVSKKFVIMILPPTISKKAKKSKTLLKNLKKVYHFGIIGIVSMSAWFTTSLLITYLSAPSISLDRPSSGSSEPIADMFWPSIVTLSVVILGLIIERVHMARKTSF